MARTRLVPQPAAPLPRGSPELEMNPHLPYALNNFLLVRVYPGYLAGADQTWRDHEPAVLQHLRHYQVYKAQCARDHDEKALWLFRSQTEYGFSHNHLRKHCMREVILAQNCQSSLFHLRCRRRRSPTRSATPGGAPSTGRASRRRTPRRRSLRRVDRGSDRGGGWCLRQTKQWGRLQKNKNRKNEKKRRRKAGIGGSQLPHGKG